MAIAQSLLPEFDQEIRTTRSLIELVPEEKADFRPHEKSYSAGELCFHLGRLLSWAKMTLEQTEYDMAASTDVPKPTFESIEGCLALLDENAAEARAAIDAASDEQLMVGWSLKVAGDTQFTMPRVAVLRSFVMNHLIHHRGQLTVYLRLLDIPLPPVYGPTADS